MFWTSVGAWLLIPSALESFPQVSLLLLKVSTANTEICGRLAVDTFSTDHFGVFSLGVTALRPEGINSQHRNLWALGCWYLQHWPLRSIFLRCHCFAAWRYQQPTPKSVCLAVDTFSTDHSGYFPQVLVLDCLKVSTANSFKLENCWTCEIIISSVLDVDTFN